MFWIPDFDQNVSSIWSEELNFQGDINTMSEHEPPCQLSLLHCIYVNPFEISFHLYFYSLSQILNFLTWVKIFLVHDFIIFGRQADQFGATHKVWIGTSSFATLNLGSQKDRLVPLQWQI